MSRLDGLKTRIERAEFGKRSIMDGVGYFMFGGLIDEAIRETQLAVNEDWWAKIDASTRPQDMDWYTREQNLADVLEAWALNPFARRIVNLHAAHVVGRQLSIGSERKRVDKWVQRFWLHRKNKMYFEVYNLVDELCRAGELLITLHPNQMDGMQYMRAIPARRIVKIETDPDDYKRPLVYYELREGEVTQRPWLSPEHPDAVNDPKKPVMVHYAINVPVGATRSWGGDLDTMLPWVRRYTGWLKDRVRINKSRNAWAWKMKAANEARVRELEGKYHGGLVSGSVFVHMPNEDLDTTTAKIDAGDAQDDGRALRQAMAVGGGVAPHFLGDVWQATRATAREANAPIFQAWAMRQHLFVTMLTDLVETGMRRSYQLGKFGRWLPPEGDWQWTRKVGDLTREDNLALAKAGKTIIDMVATMAKNEWIDRKTAISWAAKFAGEVIDPAEIMRAIDNPPNKEDITDHQEQAVLAEKSNYLAGR